MKTINRIPDNKRNITGSKKRSIPLMVSFEIWFSKVVNLIGIFFLAFSSIFVFVFFPFQTIFSDNFTEDDPVIEGKIISVTETGASVNEERVYQYVYAYSPPDGGNYKGVGYATGQIFDKGDDVVVYYKQNNPVSSKVMELRDSDFPAWVGLIVLIFPLISLILIFFGTKNTLKTINILKVGELAKGKFLHKEATNTSINEQRVYAMTFEFTAKDGKTYRTVAKTHKTYDLEDDAEEQLFYNPDNPKDAVLVDTLPAAAKKYLLK